MSDAAKTATSLPGELLPSPTLPIPIVFLPEAIRAASALSRGTSPSTCKIAVYVKDRGVISLPFAIRSMSGLGARIIGLPDRGFLRVGYRADIVVFSLERIRDRATIMDPGQPSEGIDYVLVNGQFAIDNGEPTGALAGRVLIRQ